MENCYFLPGSIDLAEPVKPTVIYRVTNGKIFIANGSDNVTVLQDEAGKRMTYDPLRKTVVWFSGEEEAEYDWVGRNIYHVDKQKVFHICKNEQAQCTTVFSPIAEIDSGIESFILDPPGG